MSTTVYTMPNCVQCEQTKRYLDNKSVPYETVDITTNPEAYEMVVSLGYKSAPVVVTNSEHWSGFRLERLHQLVINHELENREVAQ